MLSPPITAEGATPDSVTGLWDSADIISESAVTGVGAGIVIDGDYMLLSYQSGYYVSILHYENGEWVLMQTLHRSGGSRPKGFTIDAATMTVLVVNQRSSSNDLSYSRFNDSTNTWSAFVYYEHLEGSVGTVTYSDTLISCSGWLFFPSSTENSAGADIHHDVAIDLTESAWETKAPVFVTPDSKHSEYTGGAARSCRMSSHEEGRWSAVSVSFISDPAVISSYVISNGVVSEEHELSVPEYPGLSVGIVGTLQMNPDASMMFLSANLLAAPWHQAKLFNRIDNGGSPSTWVAGATIEADDDLTDPDTNYKSSVFGSKPVFTADQLIINHFSNGDADPAQLGRLVVYDMATITSVTPQYEMFSHTCQTASVSMAIAPSIPNLSGFTLMFDDEEAVDLTWNADSATYTGSITSPSSPGLHTLKINVGGDLTEQEFTLTRKVSPARSQVLLSEKPVAGSESTVEVFLRSCDLTDMSSDVTSVSLTVVDSDDNVVVNEPALSSPFTATFTPSIGTYTATVAVNGVVFTNEMKVATLSSVVVASAIQESGSLTTDGYATSFSASDDVLVIGSPGYNNNVGKVDIYLKNEDGINWDFNISFTPTNLEVYSSYSDNTFHTATPSANGLVSFGASVLVSQAGDPRVYVGAPMEKRGNVDQMGAVYQFYPLEGDWSMCKNEAVFNSSSSSLPAWPSATRNVGQALYLTPYYGEADQLFTQTNDGLYSRNRETEIALIQDGTDDAALLALTDLPNMVSVASDAYNEKGGMTVTGSPDEDSGDGLVILCPIFLTGKLNSNSHIMKPETSGNAGAFGAAVAVECSNTYLGTVVVSEPANGRVYVYTNDVSGDWTTFKVSQVIEDPDQSVGSREFGSTVSLYDGKLAITASGHSTAGNQVYVFRFDTGTGLWLQESQPVSFDDSGDLFGTHTFFSDGALLINSPNLLQNGSTTEHTGGIREITFAVTITIGGSNIVISVVPATMPELEVGETMTFSLYDENGDVRMEDLSADITAEINGVSLPVTFLAGVYTVTLSATPAGASSSSGAPNARASGDSSSSGASALNKLKIEAAGQTLFTVELEVPEDIAVLSQEASSFEYTEGDNTIHFVPVDDEGSFMGSETVSYTVKYSNSGAVVSTGQATAGTSEYTAVPSPSLGEGVYSVDVVVGLAVFDTQAFSICGYSISQGNIDTCMSASRLEFSVPQTAELDTQVTVTATLPDIIGDPVSSLSPTVHSANTSAQICALTEVQGTPGTYSCVYSFTGTTSVGVNALELKVDGTALATGSITISQPEPEPETETGDFPWVLVVIVAVVVLGGCFALWHFVLRGNSNKKEEDPEEAADGSDEEEMDEMRAEGPIEGVEIDVDPEMQKEVEV
eukprot:gnl/Dysnectes_brevis/1808_a2071_1967.p1 GENE.gnl/Dysnectes_brevis/1808_a2071_1967~~gnl/Dysnectes_brevis/1808_a2071_1967.p1  ORF type:complete len:1455 (+),score=597.79 gnl/Dysnectes_brevis/1808_a2071_1967:276-4367(+)